MQNVTVAHLLQFVPSVVKKIVILGQDSSPFRHKGIHLVNAPFGIESVLSLFKSLLNEKHKSKVSSASVVTWKQIKTLIHFRFTSTTVLIHYINIFPDVCFLRSMVEMQAQFKASLMSGRNE